MAELIALYELLLNQISALDEKQRHQRERIEDQERAETIALDNIRLEHAEKFVELTERLQALYTENKNIYFKHDLRNLFQTIFYRIQEKYRANIPSESFEHDDLPGAYTIMLQNLMDSDILNDYKWAELNNNYINRSSPTDIHPMLTFLFEHTQDPSDYFEFFEPSHFRHIDAYYHSQVASAEELLKDATHLREVVALKSNKASTFLTGIDILIAETKTLCHLTAQCYIYYEFKALGVLRYNISLLKRSNSKF